MESIERLVQELGSQHGEQLNRIIEVSVKQAEFNYACSIGQVVIVAIIGIIGATVALIFVLGWIREAHEERKRLKEQHVLQEINRRESLKRQLQAEEWLLKRNKVAEEEKELCKAKGQNYVQDI